MERSNSALSEFGVKKVRLILCPLNEKDATGCKYNIRYVRGDHHIIIMSMGYMSDSHPKGKPGSATLNMSIG